MENEPVRSIQELIERTSEDYEGFPGTMPWFRGEPNNPIDSSEKPTEALPKLYRTTVDGRRHNENRLLQNFRVKAPTLGGIEMPQRKDTDLWLFLAQHVGLPTRLLDWTESMMVAVYFALQESDPVVWMLDPISLNNSSLEKDKQRDDYVFPLTWFRPPDGSVNLGSINIQGAWETDKPGVPKPVAILPTNIHPRMSVQKSCFTIHGKIKKPLTQMIRPPILVKYTLHKNNIEAMRHDVLKMGITHSILFPDLDGLAKELRDTY